MSKLKDLFHYIQTAERDEFGYHYPYGSDNSGIRFHIYSNLRQVNIMVDNETVIDMVFDPGENIVTFYPVENEICDYEAGISMKMNETIDAQVSGCWKYLKIQHAELIRGMILDILGG